MSGRDDARWLGAALALAERGVGRTSPNPSVGCVIVADGRVVGRGWTQPGGRPHAEAMALAAAGAGAHGATAYVTLEPCAHVSARGPACSDSLIAAGIARVVASGIDPDPRTAGAGIEHLRAAGITVDVLPQPAAERLNAGFFTRQRHGRAHVTLKLAVSLDGCIALPDGTSRWITGAAARRHAHLERARCDLIVVGGGTLAADDPALDVRLDGLEDRAPLRGVLSRSLEVIPAGARIGEALLVRDLDDLDPAILTILVEGGAGIATTLLAADCVDRLLIYRAPILIGGRHSIGDLGLTDLGSTHGRWRLAAALTLGPDRVEEYDRVR
ncbi:MAG: bifunctional diaminohydroxyphosphoribosylaminopyrimidine deaminase/5-amino-6-(5-phosphoribosylamino)uracil reductase RibD [Janthinobacterium lividum]